MSDENELHELDDDNRLSLEDDDNGTDDDDGHHRNDGDDDGHENHSDEETLTLLYDTVFNRTPDSEGLAAWVAELAKTGTDLDDLAELFMQSQEFINLYGENLSDDDYIEALYENTLGRASDDSGKAHWLEQLDAGALRHEILTDFSESAEHISLILPKWQDTTLPNNGSDSNDDDDNGVDDNDDHGSRRNDGDDDGHENHSDEETLSLLYDSVFNRTPDSEGLAFWVAELAKTGTDLDDLAELFMQSQEFINLYGENLSDDDYIEALYENTLGRASDDSGKAHWLEQLDAGALRHEILTDFSESTEHVSLILTGDTAIIPDVPLA